MRSTVAVALGLILGGALGNLADRALNGSGFGGPVTDFIDFQVWPIFNLADSAIVIGVVLLAFASLDGSDEPADAPETTTPVPPGTTRP
jgi:signal peptidase II